MTTREASGRDALGRNVLASWVAYIVFIVFGFIMPRAIDEAVGQQALGVWDFAWSIVHYLSLSKFGIGSSVNRYVARYRSRNDSIALSRTVSTINAIQVSIAILVAIASVILAKLVPAAFGDRLGDQADVAGSLILFLGLSLAVQMAFDVFRGILTGCHKWVAYNVINSVGYAIAASAMLVILLLGGGLAGIALAYLVVTVLTELVRLVLGLRACPEVDFSLSNVNLPDARKVVKFGLKMVLIGLPRMITIQTVSIFVVANMGASMLAILARPLALTNHVLALIEKFANVLTPTAGSLQGAGQMQDLREFTVTAMRTGWLLAIFPTAYLAVFGDKLVYLWMGDGYANWPVMIVLAVGSLISASQFSLLKILVGLDAHGPVAKLCFVFSIAALAIGSLVVSVSGWNLTAAAALISLPSIVGIGIVVPYIGCRKLSISLKEYAVYVLRDPVLLLCVTVPALVALREVGPDSAAAGVLLGLGLHSGIAALLLWKDLRLIVHVVLRPKAV